MTKERELDEKPVAYWDTQNGTLTPAVPLSSERTCFEVPLLPLYLHPTPKATQDENPVAFISKNGFRFNADIEPIEHGIEVPLYLHPRFDIVDELVEALKGLAVHDFGANGWNDSAERYAIKARAALEKLDEE